MMGLSGSGRTERPLFTPTQWQELEHQALVYKYMVSGVPVPPELIFSIRRSLDSSLASRLLQHHQPFGWGCFQMGYGRKPDLEPGRCRRTDGKKWRCSREAYPDSKYCEKHMHRGRNRTRKSNENPTISFNTTKNNTSSVSSSSSSVDCYSNSTVISAHQTSPRFSSNSSRSTDNSNSSRAYLSHSMNYPYPSPSSKSSDSGLSLQNSSSHQFNVLGSSGICPQSDKDFRYLHGTLEGVGERTFFPEASRSIHDSLYHSPLTVMNSPYHRKVDDDQRQHCFVMGTDMFNKPSGTVSKALEHQQQQDQDQDQDEEQEQEPKKPLLHFFGDHWPSTKDSSDSWLDLSSNSR